MMYIAVHLVGLPEFDAKAFTPHLLPVLGVELKNLGFGKATVNQKTFHLFGKPYTFELHPFTQFGADLSWAIPWGGGPVPFEINFTATMGLRGTFQQDH